jgi:hypothetical protein
VAAVRINPDGLVRAGGLRVQGLTDLDVRDDVRCSMEHEERNSHLQRTVQNNDAFADSVLLQGEDFGDRGETLVYSACLSSMWETTSAVPRRTRSGTVTYKIASDICILSKK